MYQHHLLAVPDNGAYKKVWCLLGEQHSLSVSKHANGWQASPLSPSGPLRGWQVWWCFHQSHVLNTRGSTCASDSCATAMAVVRDGTLLGKCLDREVVNSLQWKPQEPRICQMPKSAYVSMYLPTSTEFVLPGQCCTLGAGLASVTVSSAGCVILSTG